jgi:tungstate transport system ATP-binding protein
MAVLSNLPLLFSSVSYRVGELTLLDRISLTIDAGAPTAILGPNGAGKSTLLAIAMGLTRPSSGAVSWGGRSDAHPLRRAIVFQNPIMLRRSVRGNITFALEQAGVAKAARESRLQSLLASVGLSELADRPARRLSGGEQKRVALARALARDPDLLLLDEPTADLDPAAARAVEAIIAGAAASGVKILMVSHDAAQVRRLAGDVHFLVKGRLRESTPSAKFFSDEASPLTQQFLRGDLIPEM